MPETHGTGRHHTESVCFFVHTHYPERRNFMNREVVKQLILESLSRKLGDGYHLSIHRVLKTNQTLDGLAILREGESAAVNIYLDPYYKDLENISNLEAVTDMILQDYFHAAPLPKGFDAASIRDPAWVKDRLQMRLINRHLNRELLKDVPHLPFLDDFAAVVYCLIEGSDDWNAGFLVHNSSLKMWNSSREELLSLALECTRRRDGADIRPMSEIMKELAPWMDTENVQDFMWVLTNRQKLFGASAALFGDVLEDFAEKHGDFCAIFSSVHEILLIPSPDDSQLSSITDINLDVNATKVAPGEVLGTKAYFYRRGSGFVF